MAFALQQRFVLQRSLNRDDEYHLVSRLKYEISFSFDHMPVFFLMQIGGLQTKNQSPVQLNVTKWRENCASV